MNQIFSFWDLFATLIIIIGDFLVIFTLLPAIFYFLVKIVLHKKISSIANLLAGGSLALTVTILGLLGKLITGEWNTFDNGLMFQISDTLMAFIVSIVLIIYLGTLLLSKIESN
ncbi:MAG: hypothetical protein H6652_05460 [Ardenticatenaceae bacterium]|nr:hypothetical protein [Ardenticatenaceae bacterium]MCB8946627.1 hypothetical protein [Ardenticatenaceae bacterium]